MLGVLYCAITWETIVDCVRINVLHARERKSYVYFLLAIWHFATSCSNSTKRMRVAFFWNNHNYNLIKIWASTRPRQCHFLLSLKGFSLSLSLFRTSNWHSVRQFERAWVEKVKLLLTLTYAFHIATRNETLNYISEYYVRGESVGLS